MIKRLIIVFFGLAPVFLFAQAGPKVSPTKVVSPVYFDQIPSLKKLAGKPSVKDVFEKERNEGIEKIGPYPYPGQPLPGGKDPVLQSVQGDKVLPGRGIDLNFDGLSGSAPPLDNNGTIGKNHYLQSINVDYGVYNRDGTVAIAQTSLTDFFEGILGVNGEGYGDPIVLYDENAERWFMSQIGYDYSTNGFILLLAISATDDPTGAWYRWSYPVLSIPDYPKYGISPQSYLLGTNNGGDGSDIFAFDRAALLAGDANAQMIQFQNPNRPNVNIHAVLPMDTDGPFPADPGPAQFITINDDAWNGNSDQLWIYELDVDWTVPDSATFQRTQTLDVPVFDSDFGDLIEGGVVQPNGQELSSISIVLMNRAPMRYFDNEQSVVCLHTVDVDGNNHAGLRWYELRRVTGGEWTIRQSGTYAPDTDSRWIGSIAQNADKEIAIAYSVASPVTHPSIRYCGQSSEANTAASGVLDIQEVSVFEGTHSQNDVPRWGDYGNMAVDPVDNHTFWYSGTYVKDNGEDKGTKNIAFNFSPGPVVAAFSPSSETACLADTVTLMDQSLGIPDSWQWTITPATISFVNGTNANSASPQITFNDLGNYTIQLIAANNISSDTLIKQEVLTVLDVYADFSSDVTTVVVGGTVNFQSTSGCSPDTWTWSFPGGEPSSFTGENPPAITYNELGLFPVSLTVTKGGGSDVEEKIEYIEVTDCQYCEAIYNDPSEEFISRVRMNDLDNSSGPTGYSDFTDMFAYMAPGDTVELKVDVTIDGNYTENVAAWVDWNEDCMFSDVDERYDVGQLQGTDTVVVLTASTAIVVPAGVIPGTKRMRIRNQFLSSPSPCGNGIYGETEDYSIVVDPDLTKEIQSDVVKRVYPNPASDILNFELDAPRAVAVPVTILDASGKILKMRKISIQSGYNRVRMSVRLLPAGTYFISLGELGGFSFMKQ